MADQINDIVQVSITANSKTPSRLGFGTPFILTYHTRFSERLRRYSDLASMAADGFTSYDEAYRKAAAIFAQNPTVPEVVIGRLPSAPAFVTQVTVTSAVQDQHVQFKIVEPTTGAIVQIDRTIAAAATTTTEATAIELLTEAVNGVDSTSSGAVISITPTVAGRKVHVFDCVNCDVQETTAASGYDTELTAVRLEDDDWYFVLIGSSSTANVAAVAAWVIANPPKMYFTDTSDSNLLTGVGTMGSALKASGNTRTVILYAANSHEAAASAWVGVGAPQDPGSITWALKTLVGVTAKALTTTQRTNLETANINHYQSVRGIGVTRPGMIVGGEWIDVTHGIDALTADIQEAVFALLANSGKTPMTPAGLDLVQTTIEAVLARYEGTSDQPGLLAPKQSKVIMPAFGSISTADKNQRKLKNVRFNGTLAGAIHFVGITGTLTN